MVVVVVVVGGGVLCYLAESLLNPAGIESLIR